MDQPIEAVHEPRAEGVGELHELNADELKQAAGGQDGTAHAKPH